MNLTVISDYEKEIKPILYQNLLTSNDPGFTSRPTPFVRGGEKVYKIGNRCFNYIDYMEAHLHIDCYTYRSKETLDEIEKQIQQAIQQAYTGA